MTFNWNKMKERSFKNNTNSILSDFYYQITHINEIPSQNQLSKRGVTQEGKFNPGANVSPRGQRAFMVIYVWNGWVGGCSIYTRYPDILIIKRDKVKLTTSRSAVQHWTDSNKACCLKMYKIKNSITNSPIDLKMFTIYIMKK